MKTDRDVVVDVLPIEVEGGGRVEGDEGKGEAIIRGLGKREELSQEGEGFWEEVDIGEEEVEEIVGKQKEKKAAGKVVWGVRCCRCYGRWDGEGSI